MCSVCGDLFHATVQCAGVTSSEVNVLKLKTRKPLMVYRCTDCTANGGENKSLAECILELKTSLNEKYNTMHDEMQEISKNLKTLQDEVAIIPQLKTQVDNLKTEVCTLKSRLELLESNGAVSAEANAYGDEVNSSNFPQSNCYVDNFLSMQKMLDEAQERQRRAKNILIFKCPDSKDPKDHDLISVKNFLNKINLSTELTNTNIRRFGKFNEGLTRPICVTMDSRADVLAVLTNWNLLPSTFNASADYTKFQRELYGKLRKEADKYNSKNPPIKKYVKYVKGTPTLSFKNAAANEDSAENSTDGADEAKNSA